MPLYSIGTVARVFHSPVARGTPASFRQTSGTEKSLATDTFHDVLSVACLTMNKSPLDSVYDAQLGEATVGVGREGPGKPSQSLFVSSIGKVGLDIGRGCVLGGKVR